MNPVLNKPILSHSSAHNNPGVSIIIPVYNEAPAIKTQMANILSIQSRIPVPSEIICINDGSTDNTGAILKTFPAIKVIDHSSNTGYGSALKTGIRNSQYDLICIIDADGTYPCNNIPVLVNHILAKGSDMVVAARIGANVHIAPLRKPAKWILNQLANYLTGTRIPDLNSGLRIFRKEAALPFWNILPDGFSFTTTITLALLVNACKVDYLPIDYLPRQGRSKIRPIADTILFFQLILRTIMYFQPLKVFIPLSGFFFLTSFLLLLYRIFIFKGFAVTIILLFTTGIQMLALGMVADMINQRLK